MIGWALGLVAVAVHLWASGGYGYFRDELYFIVCGQRLDWGFVDQPPLVPAVAGAMNHLFPGSLVMLRLLPALTHGATVVLAAATARRLGGAVWATALAALCVLTGGVFLGIGTTLSTGALEPLAGLFCSYALIRIIRDRDERWWLALGVAAGIALEAKYLLAFWLAALGIGILSTPARRSLARPYIYGGAAIALLIVAPNLLWQHAQDWPFLELGQAAVTHKNVVLPPVEFLHQIVLQFNPGTSPVWIAGFLAFALWRPLADLRLFAIAFAVLVGAMILLHGKPYYLANAMPVLLVGGAVALEAWLGRVLRTVLATAVVAFGLIVAPFAVPILPIEQFAAYQDALGIAPPPDHQGSPAPRLQQYYADMFGWPELAAQIARIYRSLPPEEQARAVFLGNNYGEAAAIDVFGTPLGLPPAISGHNNYFLWGPRGHDGSVVIRFGGRKENLLKSYASCDSAGIFEHRWAMPYETGQTIWVCRNRNPPTDKDWDRFKHYE